jgi:hypothetical protein
MLCRFDTSASIAIRCRADSVARHVYVHTAGRLELHLLASIQGNTGRLPTVRIDQDDRDGRAVGAPLEEHLYPASGISRFGLSRTLSMRVARLIIRVLIGAKE